MPDVETGDPAAPPVQACPVCSGPDDAERCSRCGWLLTSEHVLGDVTTLDLNTFEDRLAQATQRHRLTGAALAAGYPEAGDATALLRYSRLLGLPDPTENALALARDGAAEVVSTARARGPLTEAGANSAPPGLHWDVDRQGVWFVRTLPDRDGGLDAVEAASVDHLPWRDLLPGHPDEDHLAIFLATGHDVPGSVPPLDLVIDRLLATVMAGCPPPPDVIRCSPAGWAVPAALTAALAMGWPSAQLRTGPPELPCPAADHRLHRAMHRGLLQVPPASALAVISAAQDPTIRWVAAGAADGALGRWSWGSDVMVVSAPEAHRGRISAVVVDPQTGMVASGGVDGTVRVWDAGPVGPVRPGRMWVATRHPRWVNAVALSAGRVYSVADDGVLRAVVLDDARHELSVNVGWDFARALDASRDGALVAVGGTAGHVALIRASTGSTRRVIQVGSPVGSLAFAPTGRHLAIATSAGLTSLDLTEGHVRHHPVPVASPVRCLAAVTDDVVLAGLDDGSVWALRDGVLHCIGRHDSPVRTVNLLADGRFASGDARGLIRLWPQAVTDGREAGNP